MTRDERAELVRDLFDPDHPNYAQLAYGQYPLVPGSFSRSPIITDEYQNVRSTFTLSKYDLDDLGIEEDSSFEIVVDGTERIKYFAAEIETAGPSTKIIVLGSE